MKNTVLQGRGVVEVGRHQRHMVELGHRQPRGGVHSACVVTYYSQYSAITVRYGAPHSVLYRGRKGRVGGTVLYVVLYSTVYSMVQCVHGTVLAGLSRDQAGRLARDTFWGDDGWHTWGRTAAARWAGSLQQRGGEAQPVGERGGGCKRMDANRWVWPGCELATGFG
jgi:hypothetical protein